TRWLRQRRALGPSAPPRPRPTLLLTASVVHPPVRSGSRPRRRIVSWLRRCAAVRARDDVDGGIIGARGRALYWTLVRWNDKVDQDRYRTSETPRNSPGRPDGSSTPAAG